MIVLSLVLLGFGGLTFVQIILHMCAVACVFYPYSMFAVGVYDLCFVLLLSDMVVRLLGQVRAFVESQTGDIQAMSPALTRLLATRAKEEREAAERAPGEFGASPYRYYYNIFIK